MSLPTGRVLFARRRIRHKHDALRPGKARCGKPMPIGPMPDTAAWCKRCLTARFRAQ